ncbi:unnamed protein product, partial [Ixodes pacificus]
LGRNRQCRDAELQLRTLRGNVEKPESRSSLLPPAVPLLSLLALEPLLTLRRSGDARASRTPSERQRRVPSTPAPREGAAAAGGGTPWTSTTGCLSRRRGVVCNDDRPV